jgi:DNA-binding transcriptional ArsR family regulator
MPTKTKLTAKRQAAQNLAKALSHPVREEALSILTEREASPTEISRELGEDASYHVKRLEELGCVELVREEQVAGVGAVAKFYRSVARPLVDIDEFAAMHPAAAHHFAWRAASKPINDFAKAVEGGLLDDVETTWVTRTPHLLDAKGIDEMSALHRETYEQAQEIQARSDGRRVNSSEEGVRVSSSQMFFPIP